MDLAQLPGIVGVTLDRLEGVKETHIRTWFDTHVREFVNSSPGTVPNVTILEEQMMPRVRQFFQDRDYVDDEGRISMETIAKNLRLLLEESLVKGAS
jgi:hypothetical protein